MYWKEKAGDTSPMTGSLISQGGYANQNVLKRIKHSLSVSHSFSYSDLSINKFINSEFYAYNSHIL